MKRITDERFSSFCIHQKTFLCINCPKLIWFEDVAIVSQYQRVASCSKC